MVKTGQIVKVKVLEVDLQRMRIALTMRLDDMPGQQARRDSDAGGGPRGNDAARQPFAKPVKQARGPSAMALAFAKLKK